MGQDQDAEGEVSVLAMGNTGKHYLRNSTSYANLGLASNMKIHAVGGVEKELPSKVRAKESEESVDGGEKGTPETMHMGQIIRDDAGNVLEIRMPDTNQGSSKGKSKEEATPWGKPLDATTMETPSVPLTFDDEHNSGKKSADTDAVRCESACTNSQYL